MANVVSMYTFGTNRNEHINKFCLHSAVRTPLHPIRGCLYVTAYKTNHVK